MIPKIGVSSKVFGMKDWYKKAQESDFNVIEINRVNTPIFLIPEYIEKIRSYLQGKDLSIHSESKHIFTENKQFTLTEINILKSEVLICQTLGIKDIVFHLKHDFLTSDEIKQFKEVINFAKKHKIDLIYESNAWLNPDLTFENLKNFPELNYNLDFGHLNVGLHKFKFDLNDFLKKIRDRVVYLHVHNNHGEKDEHLSLKNGTLDWKKVLDSLDMQKVKKIIIEVHNLEDAQESLQELQNYFQK